MNRLVLHSREYADAQRFPIQQDAPPTNRARSRPTFPTLHATTEQMAAPLGLENGTNIGGPMPFLDARVENIHARA